MNILDPSEVMSIPEEKIENINYDETPDAQFAENQDVVEDEDDPQIPSSEEKRLLLKKTKIVKQTWSIQEIYQKIKSGRLVLAPDYQRNEIWKTDKKTAFIESLYMGIIVPPIYVVEIPGKDLLDDSIYEVVDGKQRLTAIEKFLTNKLQLSPKSLEYYKDWFANKYYNDIRELYQEMTFEMLSSVLDIYVITANSPEFTKYDIFSRLNKGAEKLKVNEIRKAIYRSALIDRVISFVKNQLITNKAGYSTAFSQNDIKRFDDYGRFFASVSFYKKSDITSCVVSDYNSRPRDMINAVLQSAQTNPELISVDTLDKILDFTLKFKIKYNKVAGIDYIINACVPFINDYETILAKGDDIISDPELTKTISKSAPKTSFVNARLKRVKNLLERWNKEN